MCTHLKSSLFWVLLPKWRPELPCFRSLSPRVFCWLILGFELLLKREEDWWLPYLVFICCCW